MISSCAKNNALSIIYVHLFMSAFCRSCGTIWNTSLQTLVVSLDARIGFLGFILRQGASGNVTRTDLSLESLWCIFLGSPPVHYHHRFHKKDHDNFQEHHNPRPPVFLRHGSDHGKWRTPYDQHYFWRGSHQYRIEHAHPHKINLLLIIPITIIIAFSLITVKSMPNITFHKLTINIALNNPSLLS